jgi:hypothetical protein
VSLDLVKWEVPDTSRTIRESSFFALCPATYRSTLGLSRRLLHDDLGGHHLVSGLGVVDGHGTPDFTISSPTGFPASSTKVVVSVD